MFVAGFVQMEWDFGIGEPKKIKVLFLSIIGIAYESICGTQPFSYTPKPLLMWMTCNVGLLIQV